MSRTRKIEVFSAGCPLCDEAEKTVRDIACSSCDVTVLNMNEPETMERAKQLGIQFVPAVAIDGKLTDCCDRRGIDADTLKNAGLGKSLSPNW